MTKWLRVDSVTLARSRLAIWMRTSSVMRSDKTTDTSKMCSAIDGNSSRVGLVSSACKATVRAIWLAGVALCSMVEP